MKRKTIFFGCVLSLIILVSGTLISVGKEINITPKEDEFIELDIDDNKSNCYKTGRINSFSQLFNVEELHKIIHLQFHGVTWSISIPPWSIIGQIVNEVDIFPGLPYVSWIGISTDMSNDGVVASYTLSSQGGDIIENVEIKYPCMIMVNGFFGKVDFPLVVGFNGGTVDGFVLNVNVIRIDD